MATDLDLSLTDQKIEELAQVIALKHMATIAIKYLGLSYEEVEDFRTIKQNDSKGFNRDILVIWRNRNAGINQVQKITDILKDAAKDEGNVDPYKINPILDLDLMTKMVTEDEFVEIAKNMKPHMERRMKIEPFPWLRDYYVDMNKLYTKLTLYEIENTVCGENPKKISRYIQLFKTSERNKILIKGDPWTGKTTLVKKMTFDWTKGVFEVYFIVFYVGQKFVEQEESIEKIILQEHPELEGLGVSVEKLRFILDRFSDRCLLILDGLDEHGLGKNKDIVKIIQDKKLNNCGVVISSRPHCTKEIENNFPTIIRVGGFSERHARHFLSKLFVDKEIIGQIMDFRPSGSREDFPIYKCPILLSILSRILNGKKMNLSDGNICMGDLYLRIVQYLYKIFTIRKGKEFVRQDFVADMKRLGQLALETSKYNSHVFLRSEVFRIAGDFAFEYGFFAGREDFSLLDFPTADIYVSFVHKSIEEFFWSFGFLQSLDDGKSVKDILGSDCEEPTFIINPFILKNCSCLLTEDFFKSPKSIYDKLDVYDSKYIRDYPF